MKKFKFVLFKIICGVLFCLLGVYVVCFAIPKATSYEIYKEKEVKTKIYNVWHVETFEGGSKARIDFLKNTAREIEKKNAGILFMFKQISPENLTAELEIFTPEIISFGFGVGKVVLPYLVELTNTYNVRDTFVKSAKFNNSVMCLPYIASGYAYFTHATASEKLCFGSSCYVYPQSAISNDNLLLFSCASQYEAYKTFIYDKKSALVGTARDVFRVSNLNDIGRLSATITPINSYTDLMQYCGITLSDNITQTFIKNLLTNENQLNLVNYSLFSVKNNKIYSSGIYSDIEEAIFNAKVPNVFYE